MEYKNKLWRKLERDILPFVSKPARYVGNEHNIILKTHVDGITKIALAFPEMYEIGMSYLGMRILYHLINQRSEFLAERAFMVWPDMEKRMIEKDIPLFSLETSTPLKDFDIIGFHLTYEMTYTSAISMLELARIPPYSKDRDDSEPITIAGGPSTINPEPMADFIDAFFLGDAEEGIFEIIDSIRDSKTAGLSRVDLLGKLSEIPGIYVPRFYEPIYDSNGRFDSLRKLKTDIPDRIKIRSVPELSGKYYPDKPIVPYIETAHDHLSIEIMRGCVRGCRFCQAGYQYRPRRQRDVDSICTEIFSSLAATGYDDVTLLSLSSTDYDNLSEVIDRITPRFSEMNIGVGLPSLRPETITSSLLRALSTGRKSGLTLAPEAGTERMRNILGKNIKDEDIYDAVEIALDSGWQTIKLYFMIGLPGESDDDIEGIINMLRKISYLARQRDGRFRINVSISPFSPKSHTPWQWERQADISELKKKIDKICRRVRKPNIVIKYPDLDQSYLEGVLGRGDRRLGRVIYEAYKRGSRLDGWSEWFDAGRWYDAFDEAGIDITSYTCSLDDDSPLPWDHIDKGISREFLKKDKEKSKQAIPPDAALKKKSQPSSTVPPDTGYGRKARRIAGQTFGPKSAYRLRIRYSRGSELRFLSHLDIIRTIFRSIRRSRMPVAFSQGYHPHLKVSFGPPLPVGYTSEAEYLDLILTQPYREEFIARLKDMLPFSLEITGYRHFFTKPGSLTKQLNLARYEIPPIEGVAYETDSLKEILNEKSMVVKRAKEDIVREIAAGEFIDDLRLHDDCLIADIRQTPDGHIKPEEILIFGLGVDSELVKPLIIHRKSQFHRFGGRMIEPLELV